MALRDLFSFSSRASRPASPAARPSELDAALAELSRLGVDRPELAGAATTLAALLRAAFETVSARSEAAAIHADTELIVAAWRAGVPAVRAGAEPPSFDPGSLDRRARAICQVLVDQPSARALARCLGKSVHLAEWARRALVDHDADGLDEAARSGGVTPEFARSLLRLVLLPDLAARSALLATIRPEGAWTRGECPHCGEPPMLAESRGLEQRRHLRCGVCASDWPGDRLRCPFCGESDHRRLHYRFVDGEEDRYRLTLCESCAGRLPVVSTLAPRSAPALLVTELATAHLSALADEG